MYLRVMSGDCSNASGEKLKINQINTAKIWNPDAEDERERGGYNFSDEKNILRWLIRGDTLYDVMIPSSAEIKTCENKNTPGGVFIANQIIPSNPRKITDELALKLYKSSQMPEDTYFQCLCFLSLKNFEKTCSAIIFDKVNETNIERAIKIFHDFLEIKEEEKTECYIRVEGMLNTLLNCYK